MYHRKCCVLNCRNTNKNSHCTFHRFPARKYLLEQKKKWITAVQKINGESWNHTANNYICSSHFMGNTPSQETNSPSYVPCLFTDNKLKLEYKDALVKRYDRFKKRVLNSTSSVVKKKTKVCKVKKVDENAQVSNTISSSLNSDEMDQYYNIENTKDSVDSYQTNEILKTSEERSNKVDKECQVFIYENNSKAVKKELLVCNKFVNKIICSEVISNTICEVEIQTDITGNITLMDIGNSKKFEDKCCATDTKTFVDTYVGPDILTTVINSNKQRMFAGYTSIENDEQLLDLAGVSRENFEFLLRRMKKSDKYKISIENRLLIFLVKMKTALSFSALSVLFNVHRTNISKIFFSTLQHLTKVTEDCVFWPEKDIVQGTMPDCFKPEYENTRVIIDCREFRIDVPSNIDNRVFCYSNYKKGFTAKVLIGITPGGFISFKSKAAGGRKSDSQITVDSGLMNLLEEGDIVLADKGFPEFKSCISQNGKQVLVIMPPFLEKKNEFSNEETKATYSIARVRIHVERTMQRLRTYNILNKIPEFLFFNIDDIIHMCCVLVNLQAPIIADCKENFSENQN